MLSKYLIDCMYHLKWYVKQLISQLKINGNCSSMVEYRIVIPVVVGSSPISYPIDLL